MFQTAGNLEPRVIIAVCRNLLNDLCRFFSIILRLDALPFVLISFLKVPFCL